MIVTHWGFPLPKLHVSSTPSTWSFKWVLDVANNVAAIIHHNPKILQSPNVRLHRHLCRIYCRLHQFWLLISVLILPIFVSCQHICQSHFSQSLILLWKRRHQESPGTDPPPLPIRQILFFPPRGALCPKLLDDLQPWIPFLLFSAILRWKLLHSYMTLWSPETYVRPPFRHTWILITSTIYILKMSAHTQSKLSYF